MTRTAGRPGTRARSLGCPADIIQSHVAPIPPAHRVERMADTAQRTVLDRVHEALEHVSARRGGLREGGPGPLAGLAAPLIEGARGGHLGSLFLFRGTDQFALLGRGGRVAVRS